MPPKKDKKEKKVKKLKRDKTKKAKKLLKKDSPWLNKDFNDFRDWLISKGVNSFALSKLGNSHNNRNRQQIKEALRG